MAPSTRNTDGLAPHSALDTDRWMFPPGESLENKYQAALLLVAVLRDTHPHIDVEAWLRYQHAERN